MPVILALDPGERRTGIATCDPEGRLAHPLMTHDRRRDPSLLAVVADLCREYGAEHILMGHPVEPNGESGSQADHAERLAKKLKNYLREHFGPVEIELVDERHTTAEARRILAGRKRSRADHDALAATLLLQAWLDARRPEGESP